MSNPALRSPVASLAAAILASCATPSSPATGTSPASRPTAAPASSAPGAGPSENRTAGQSEAAQPAAKAWPSQIRFLEDDWAGAVALAKAGHKPLFVDAWATWCHSCLSMQRFVFPDAGLRTIKDAVVWISIETEQEKNRDFVERFPSEGLPTFLLVDPDTQEVIGRWLGSGTANEMRGFVQEGVVAYAAKAGGPGLSEAARAEHEGDAAQVKRDRPAALAAYRRALEQSAKGDPARFERLVKLVSALGKDKGGAAECTQIGLAELSRMPETAVGADFAATVANCSEPLLKTDEAARKLRDAAEARLAALTANPDVPFSADDRSDALATLAGMQDDDGHKEEAKATMRRRVKVLEDAAASAPDAITAATFDAHRTDSYVYLGELEKAERLLAQREKEVPGDYNPPARLARVLHLEKREAEAEAAVDRALGQMTKGPRRVGILGLKAQILEAQGKPKEPVLREQLAVLRGLPSTQKRPETEARLEAQLQELAAKR